MWQVLKWNLKFFKQIILVDTNFSELLNFTTISTYK